MQIYMAYLLKCFFLKGIKFRALFSFFPFLSSFLFNPVRKTNQSHLIAGLGPHSHVLLSRGKPGPRCDL